MKKKINIIAEIGINHDGSFNQAKKLINLAKKSGADAVKFQLFKPEDLYISIDKSFKGVSKFHQVSLVQQFNSLKYCLLTKNGFGEFYKNYFFWEFDATPLANI